MATLQPFNVPSLVWGTYINDQKSLLSVAAVDFSVYSALTVIPKGVFSTRGMVDAEGVVIDNLSNKTPVYVMAGKLTLTSVPAYQKVVLPLRPGFPQLTIAGSSGIISLTFYTGEFIGATAGYDAYLAYQAANVATLTNGATDVYANTLRWNVDFQLPSGTDLNTVVISGFYDVQGPLNGPTDTAANLFYLIVNTYSQSPGWIRQQLASLDNSEALTWTRYRVNNAWSVWRRVVGLDSAGKIPPYDFNGRPTFGGNTPWDSANLQPPTDVLAHGTAVSAATITFTVPTGYRAFRVILGAVTPNTVSASALTFRTSNAGGIVSTYSYAATGVRMSDGAAYNAFNSSEAAIICGPGMDNSSNNSFEILVIPSVQGATIPHVTGRFNVSAGGTGRYTGYFGGVANGTPQMTNFIISPASGVVFTSCQYVIEGYRN